MGFDAKDGFAAFYCSCLGLFLASWDRGNELRKRNEWDSTQRMDSLRFLFVAPESFPRRVYFSFSAWAALYSLTICRAAFVRMR